MADRKIWTEDEKIVIHIGDDFFFDIFNSFMEPIYKWIAEGKERVALDNLAKAKLQQFNKNATTKNLNDMKKQIRAAADKLIPPTATIRKQALLSGEVPEGYPDTRGMISTRTGESPGYPFRKSELLKERVVPKKIETWEKIKRSVDADRIRRQALEEMGASPEEIARPLSRNEELQLEMISLARQVEQQRRDERALSYIEEASQKSVAVGPPRNLFDRPLPSIERSRNSREIELKETDRILTEGPDELPRFGYKAGKRNIENFFEDTFGLDIDVEYKFPGDLSVYDRELRDYGEKKKKGGKVKKKSKKKYTSKKKYSMNRGGMASVRKPTRA
jgi:hypothetical protein